MPKPGEQQNSILVVSGSERFNALVRQAADRVHFPRIVYHADASTARRSLLEYGYDLVVINCPLPDEFGHELAMDAAGRWGAGVLVVVPAEVYEMTLENVTDAGVLAVSKPTTRERLGQAIRFLAAMQGRMRDLRRQVQKAAEKMDELRVVSKAKILLVEKKHMTEEEAHRLIGREAMDHGLSRRRIAEQILDEL